MKLNITGKSAQVVAAAKKTVRKAPQVLRDEGGVKDDAKNAKSGAKCGAKCGRAPAKPGR